MLTVKPQKKHTLGDICKLEVLKRCGFQYFYGLPFTFQQSTSPPFFIFSLVILININDIFHICCGATHAARKIFFPNQVCLG
jgi:hypothetical protein